MIDINELKPYKSMIIAKVEGDIDIPAKELVDSILKDLGEVLELKVGTNERRERRNKVFQNVGQAQILTIGVLHYVEERAPSWTRETTILDSINHLAVVILRNRYAAIYLSESNRKRAVVHKMIVPGTIGLAALDLIPQGLLNAAFVTGPARTLWLSGTHRQTSIKADNKVLSGLNLRDTLDPLGDQTFHFTAARCVSDMPDNKEPVGIAPRKSQIWMGVSRNWLDFTGTVNKILAHVENITTPNNAPLPVVAVSTINVDDVGDPYDVGFVPPELVDGDPTIPSEYKQKIEKWGYNSNFEVIKVNGNEFDAEVYLYGRKLGVMSFSLDLTSVDNIKWTVEKKSVEAGEEESFKEAISFTHRKDWIKIWFESGHTISNGDLFEVRHRDMPFIDFEWANLADYNVNQEKPKPLNDIGNQNSLFDWMVHYWPNLDASNTTPGGWLACDDGAMEIADFIHLDDQKSPPVLTLIHVKASGSDNPNRQISVSDYEVVTAQAVKNLRSLDRILLSAGLQKGIGKKIGKAVWHNHLKTTRDEMINALGDIGANYDRRVIVFQPRVTKSMLTNTRKKPNGTNYARLRQLDTLLLGAAANCKGLGVEFSVLGDVV